MSLIVSNHKELIKMKKLKLFATVACMSLLLCGCVNKNAVITVNGDAITKQQYEKAFDAVADNSMFSQMGIDLKKDENSFLHLKNLKAISMKKVIM